MDNFIKPVDALSESINTQAKILFDKISNLPVMDLNLPTIPLEYYINRHHERKFFSVQTAAELLYRSIKLKGKPLHEITLMEYGAGLGSLFLLAKMIGCKTVVYNDILDDMVDAAGKISNYLNIPIDFFIGGNHKATIEGLKTQQLQCDIILSRNVVEHIYDIDSFYGDMAIHQPNALVYFSTTANDANPAMLWYHKRVHSRHEKRFLIRRKEIIKESNTGMNAADIDKLAIATRGLALTDLENAIDDYKENGILPDPSIHHTNTCNPDDGNWAEHLLPIREYKSIIESKGYKLTVLPAFWDTHYHSAIKNVVGKTMNFITNLLGPKGGLKTTAFIYVIAEKNN